MADRPPIEEHDPAARPGGDGSPRGGRGGARPPLRDGAPRADRRDGAARAGEPNGSVLGGGREGAGAPPLFFRSFRDFIRVLPGAAQRFWVLVIATGMLSGIGAGGLLLLLRAVQGLAWPEGEGFVGSVEASSPLR